MTLICMICKQKAVKPKFGLTAFLDSIILFPVDSGWISATGKGRC